MLSLFCCTVHHSASGTSQGRPWPLVWSKCPVQQPETIGAWTTGKGTRSRWRRRRRRRPDGYQQFICGEAPRSTHVGDGVRTCHRSASRIFKQTYRQTNAALDMETQAHRCTNKEIPNQVREVVWYRGLVELSQDIERTSRQNCIPTRPSYSPTKYKSW